MPHAGRAAGLIRLIDGETFVVTDYRGDLSDDVTGFFHDDTRHLSSFDLTVDGERPSLVTSHPLDAYSACFYLTNPKIDGIDEASITIVRRRVLAGGLRERLEIANHLDRSIRLDVALVCVADFISVPEVAGDKDPVDGRYATRCIDSGVELSYREGRFEATTVIDASGAACELDERSPDEPARCVLRYDVPLDAHGEWSTEIAIHPDGIDVDEETWHDSEREARRAAERFDNAFPTLHSSWKPLEAIYTRSRNDLASLRLRHFDGIDEVALSAAGMPWFMTLFGRDSLIVGYQTLPFAPTLATGALKALAALQSTEYHTRCDAEPGKIPHEMRQGRLTANDDRPFDPFYGSVDSTLWFLIVLSEHRRWTGDDTLCRELEPNARAALEWIERDGDHNGDGFIDYLSHSEFGPHQQSWKDSDDAMAFSDGRIAEAPVATCEVQGYTYDAWLRTAEIAEDVWGDRALAERLRTRAAELRSRFEDAYWMSSRGHYALALDKDGAQVDSLTSNIGHLLWSGIVSEERAEATVRSLFSPSMFNGWGIRTMSADEAKYNPISYHDGSVWPHDNSLIAMGLVRYGFRDEAARLVLAMLDAAAAFEVQRLPELFGGYDRSDSDFPVWYPEAANPHGFSSATPMLMLRAVLGLDVRNGSLVVDPHLPERFGSLELHGIHALGRQHDIIR